MKLPLRISKTYNSRHCDIDEVDGTYLACCAGANAEADAALIVRAVNSHSALVEALENLIAKWGALPAGKDSLILDMEAADALKQARAVLQKAKGE